MQSPVALTRLSSSKDKSVKAACKNAIWQISGESKEEEKKATPQATKESSPGNGHIMISYNWTHQELALKIRDELEGAGYKVWIDVDKMGRFVLSLVKHRRFSCDVI